MAKPLRKIGKSKILFSRKLTWDETAAQIKQSNEDCSDFEVTVADVIRTSKNP
jgi:hypothetical protein